MGTVVSFEDRVVIVTGAGGGLGKAYATEIARRGGAVVVNDNGSNPRGNGTSPGPADGVVAEIRAAGGRAVASYGDVADPGSAGAIVATAVDEFGRVDGLINNAGNLRSAWIGEVAIEDRDRVVATHLFGSFNMTQAVWPHMKANRYGRILFVSSNAGMLGNETLSAYGASKAAVVGLMNVASQEGAPHGILCNALMPNADTRMGSEMVPGVGDDRKRFIARVASATPQEFVAGLAVYLVSEACTSTHEIYSALGGRLARVFIGVTRGWHPSITVPSSVDDVAANIEQIRSVDQGFDIPGSLTDEYRIVAEHLDD